ncbi:MAG TPA: hypothetical protein VFQ92_07540, partial [Blastocatellia bacterium]|nr:hypothetical protein [Blastocatellia bacterium]
TIDSLEKSARRASEDAQAIAWINNNTELSDNVVCYRDPLYFLHTGRKATRSFPMREGISWQEDQKAIDVLSGLIFRIINEENGRYLVTTGSDFELEGQPELKRKVFKTILEQHPEIFVPVFEPADGGCAIYRISDGVR